MSLTKFKDFSFSQLFPKFIVKNDLFSSKNITFFIIKLTAIRRAFILDERAARSASRPLNARIPAAFESVF